MSQPEETDRFPPPERESNSKKPYHKPGFRFERVFETRALSCGKVLSTQGPCLHNKKNS